ncbi:MAG: hypothetical protein U0359_36490 [Byssovorax sp.]
MRPLTNLVSLGILFTAVACGGSSGTTTSSGSTTTAAGTGGGAGTTAGTGGSGGMGGMGGDMGTGGAGGAGGGEQAMLLAPKLDLLMKMQGALHVMWTNEQADCDTVRIERKSDTADWAEKYSVPGTVDNKMDGTANTNTMYTFRLRCEKGGVFSPYSNELSKNPKL